MSCAHAHAHTQVVSILVKQILQHLFDKITLERKYSKEVMQMNDDHIKVDNIGIGTTNTFHGMPDMRVENVSVLMIGNDEENEDESSESEQSELPGTSSSSACKDQSCHVHLLCVD